MIVRERELVKNPFILHHILVGGKIPNHNLLQGGKFKNRITLNAYMDLVHNLVWL